MAKNKISEWSSVPANNTDVGGIDIAEGCAPSGINNAIREVMAQVKDMQAGLDGDNFTIAGDLILTGGLTLDGSAGTSGQVLVSAGTGNTPTWGNAFVAGMIMLWSGSSASIPSGWLLCDGSNSTPDLRNRFVVGAGSTYAVGATGGSADAIVVSHSHTGSTSTAGEHNHFALTNLFPSNGSANNWLGRHDNTAAFQINVATSPNDGRTSNAGAHNHSFTTDSTGSSGTNANLPPYYALCYIMKS